MALVNLGEVDNLIVHRVIFENEERITEGVAGCKEILYHEPKGDGDKHFVDVLMEDGRRYRYFNFDTIEWR